MAAFMSAIIRTHFKHSMNPAKKEVLHSTLCICQVRSNLSADIFKRCTDLSPCSELQAQVARMAEDLLNSTPPPLITGKPNVVP